MSTPSRSHQLGFDAILADAETENQTRSLARKTAHLPSTLSLGLAHYRMLIEQNHAAMLAGDVRETKRLREEAGLLAVKLNKGDPGILAHEDAPGYVLARETKAFPGDIPLWGQSGRFVIDLSSMEVNIEMNGMFGIGSGWHFWPGSKPAPLIPTSLS